VKPLAGCREPPAGANPAESVKVIMSTPPQQIRVCGRPVLCKLEREHESGSHKDRAARLLVESLRRHGHRARLLVSSSGNFARAIAHHTRRENAVVTVVTDVLSPCSLLAPLQEYPHIRMVVMSSRG
jgi:threonine synthase